MIDIFMRIVFVAVILIIIYEVTNMSYDDTDNKATKERSGLRLYTDHKTGLQYIGGGLFGSTIPRLNVDGTHMRKGD